MLGVICLSCPFLRDEGSLPSVLGEHGGLYLVTLHSLLVSHLESDKSLYNLQVDVKNVKTTHNPLPLKGISKAIHESKS